MINITKFKFTDRLFTKSRNPDTLYAWKPWIQESNTSYSYKTSCVIVTVHVCVSHECGLDRSFSKINSVKHNYELICEMQIPQKFLAIQYTLKHLREGASQPGTLYLLATVGLSLLYVFPS